MKHERERKDGGEMPENEQKMAEMRLKKDGRERKRGGRVHGEKSEHRPDRRARGGAMTEREPLSAAGKMSTPPFERKEKDLD